MRVAVVHCFHSAQVPSGEDEVVTAEVAALGRAGHEVLLATAGQDRRRSPLAHLQAAATVATGWGRSPAAELERFAPDVVHVHNLFPFLGRQWLAASPAPVVTTLHSYRSTCANGYLFRDGEVCTDCVGSGPWSGVRHGCYQGSRLATVPVALGSRGGAPGDALTRASRRLLVLSERARSVMAEAGVPDSKLVRDWHFLPDDLDPGVRDPGIRDPGVRDPGVRDPGVGDDRREPTWLFVGRLSPEKGIERLVAQWPADVALRVVGDGELRPRLESLAAGKDVELVGRWPRARVVAEMGRCFGLVFPSLWFETFGLTHMEALAAGLPTLAFPPTVVADAVGAQGTGVVGSWDDLAGSLARARAGFDGLRARCRQVFDEHHTEAAFVARRGQLYREVAG